MAVVTISTGDTIIVIIAGTGGIAIGGMVPTGTDAISTMAIGIRIGGITAGIIIAAIAITDREFLSALYSECAAKARRNPGLLNHPILRSR